MPHIDQTYRTEADRTHRAIGGISMGGRSALTIVTQHPDLFSTAGGHSPVTDAAIDLSLLTAQPVRIWLDVGTDDSLLASVEQFAQMLSKQKLSYTLRTWPGQHSRSYWRAHTADYLRFYTKTWLNSQQLPLYCGTLTGAALGAARLTQTAVGRT